MSTQTIFSLYVVIEVRLLFVLAIIFHPQKVTLLFQEPNAVFKN